MKNSDEDFTGLKCVYMIKKDEIIIFQQNPICKQNKNENKQYTDKPFDLQYKNREERG